MPGLITFTFDDGISKNTELLLAYLDQENIKAAFFIIGNSLNSLEPAGSPNRHKLSMIHNAGHTIGNHTYSHPNITKLGTEELKTEIAIASNLISSITNTPVKYFRPPYGAQSSGTKKVLTDMGYKIVLWDVDARDWDLKNSKADMLAYYEKTIHGPETHSYKILQHDRRGDSVKLVPEIAKIARDRGFKIVSLDEYFDIESKS